MDIAKRKRHRKERAERVIYRKRLEEARRKYGDWIPFGYNLDLLEMKEKNKKITGNKI